jgi:hypothetical protein
VRQVALLPMGGDKAKYGDQDEKAYEDNDGDGVHSLNLHRRELSPSYRRWR